VGLAQLRPGVAQRARAIRVVPALIGHSMGCFVIQKYLEERHAPLRSSWHPPRRRGYNERCLRMVRRHPWIFVRASTFGNSADIFNTPPWPVNTCSAHTPEPIVKSCAARMEPESAERDWIR
jgi:hypothetical protein